jgi:hypothetical protein
VRIDALAVRLRPRTPTEAADLGVRLCQHAARSVYPCYALVALPVFVLALLSYEIASWLPGLVIWSAKPWFDRTILFVLSRAAFGQTTAPGDVWQAQRQVWWKGLWFTLTVRRLSLWRSLTEPVYQLEGLAIGKASTRVHQIRNRHSGPALMMTSAYHMAETALWTALVSLIFWFAPSGLTPNIQQLVTGQAQGALALVFPAAFAISVLFLEPFYVASGFAMYLNRRAELEAWDIEQEFRRAFAA